MRHEENFHSYLPHPSSNGAHPIVKQSVLSGSNLNKIDIKMIIVNNIKFYYTQAFHSSKSLLQQTSLLDTTPPTMPQQITADPIKVTMAVVSSSMSTDNRAR